MGDADVLTQKIQEGIKKAREAEIKSFLTRGLPLPRRLCDGPDLIKRKSAPPSSAADHDFPVVPSKKRKKDDSTPSPPHTLPLNKSKITPEEKSADVSQISAKSKVQKTEEERKEETRRTLFVAGCPATCTERELLEWLELTKKTDVENIRFRNVPIDPRLQCCRDFAKRKNKLIEDAKTKNAFILLKSELRLRDIITKKHGMRVGDPPCVLRLSTVSFHHQFSAFPQKLTIFVGNLYIYATEADLWSFFDKAVGDVQNVRIVRDSKTHVSKGFGFVHFKSKDKVNQALKSMNGEIFFRRPLNITKALAEDDAKSVDEKRRQKMLKKVKERRAKQANLRQQLAPNKKQGGDKKRSKGTKRGIVKVARK